MKNIIRKSKSPIGAFILAAFFLIAGAFLSLSGVTYADNPDATQDGHLVTIYDRGMEKVILSQAKTIGDALVEAGITLEANDIVEPAADQEMIASEYQVNIYRARPVIIVDGNTRTKVITAYQTATQIAASAGITLYDNDKAELGLSDDIVADGAGLQLTITRATPFSFDLYGKTATVRTQGKTVGEMLTEKGIKLSADDQVSPSQNTPITNGMSVRVWREGKQTITVEEEVAFDIEKIEDANREVGYHEIRTAGSTGTRNVTYEIIVENGVEVSRTEIASITTKQPVKQVEVIGVKGNYTTPSENETIAWNFLRSQGFSAIQTAGIMGNLQQESQFSTAGDGIAQWIGNRKANLYSRTAPSNIYTQLNFLMEELNGGYSSARDAILATDSLSTAVLIFQNKFEGCGDCRYDSRYQYAQEILGTFN